MVSFVKYFLRYPQNGIMNSLKLVFNDGQIIAKPGIGNIVHQSRESL